MKRLMVLLVSVFSCANVLACECYRASVESGFQASEKVFGAYVLAAKISGYRVEIDVGSVVPLKGAAPFKNKIFTQSSDSGCGFAVSIPARYIFFMNKDGTFDSCGATRLFGDKELGLLNSQVMRGWDAMSKD